MYVTNKGNVSKDNFHKYSGAIKAREHENFCNHLERVYEGVSKYNIKLVLDYPNEKIGREEICKLTIEKFGKHVTMNENSYFSTDFAKKRKYDYHEQILHFMYHEKWYIKEHLDYKHL